VITRRFFFIERGGGPTDYILAIKMLIYKGKKKIRENKEGNLSGATSLLCVTMQPVYFVFFFLHWHVAYHRRCHVPAPSTVHPTYCIKISVLVNCGWICERIDSA
jgi:hypothetical protein